MKIHVAAAFALLTCLCAHVEAQPAKPAGPRAAKPRPLAENTCAHDRESGRIEAHFATAGGLVWRISCYGEHCTVIAVNVANITAGRPMVASDIMDYGRTSDLAAHTAQRFTGMDVDSNKFRADLKEVATRMRPFVTMHDAMVVVSAPPNISFIIDTRGAIVARVHGDDPSVITHRELVECKGSTDIKD